MLVISGGVACLVLTVNAVFVTWWVGPAQYAGGLLTTVMALTMLLRHVATTMTYTLFAFGHERRVSLTVLADGFVTIAVTALLASTTTLGVTSAAIGSLAGVLVVNGPAMIIGLARELGVSPLQLLLPLRGWAMRFAAATTVTVTAAYLLQPHGLSGLLWAGMVVVVVYVVLMLPLALEPPLGPYIRRSLALIGLLPAPRTEPATGPRA